MCNTKGRGCVCGTVSFQLSCCSISTSTITNNQISSPLEKVQFGKLYFIIHLFYLYHLKKGEELCIRVYFNVFFFFLFERH